MSAFNLAVNASILTCGMVALAIALIYRAYQELDDAPIYAGQA